jgi:hypothetical protein
MELKVVSSETTTAITTLHVTGTTVNISFITATTAVTSVSFTDTDINIGFTTVTTAHTTVPFTWHWHCQQ